MKTTAEATDPSCLNPHRIFIHGMNFSPELIGVGLYTGDVAAYLAEQGHSVEVVTSIPHYPGWWVRAPFRNGRYNIQNLNNIKVIRCPVLLRRNCTGVWRLLASLSFAIAAGPIVMWRILRSRPDIVICVEPTLLSAPVAILAARLVRAKLILHVHDLEIDAAFTVGHLRSALLRTLALAFERFTLNRFDTIITLSEKMRERLLRKTSKALRINVIHNWVDMDKIRPMSGPNSFRREMGLSDSDFVVLYAGQIGAKQALHMVFEAAELLSSNENIHFAIAGEGPMKNEFIERYGKLRNVHFLPLQPVDKLCELLNVANLHVLPQDPDTADMVLPAKIGGMLATERPILATVSEGTELYEILREVAIIVPPGNSEALAAGVVTGTTYVLDTEKVRELSLSFSRQHNLLSLKNTVLA